MTRSRRLLALLLVLAAGVARADDDDTKGLGDDARANQAWSLINDGRYVKAREIAEAILKQDGKSFRGHYLLGVVLHRGEGNLPLSYYHLKQARALFEGRYGVKPPSSEPWKWHAFTLEELAWVAGSMDLHEEKIQYLLDREKSYIPKRPASRAWPLMRLRRYDEAHQAAEEGLKAEDPWQRSVARTALCAIEAELQRREESYRACLAATKTDYDKDERVVLYTNAAEGANGLLKFDEGERLLVEGTRHFESGTVANPWRDLVWMYVAQGRAAEAAGAAREMIKWRNGQPAYLDEQTRAGVESASAMFLIVLGRGEEAARITRRTLLRPDRTGFTSAESGQMEAATALLDRAASLVAAERKAEEASYADWKSFWRPRFEAIQYRLRAWSSGRRAAAVIASDRMLLATLRPYLAGGLAVPEWLEGDLVSLLGPGIVAAALKRARAAESLDGAEAYFVAFDAEVAYRQGDRKAAVRKALQALEQLPRKEVLLQARVAAIGGQAALESGDSAQALELLSRAWQLDPGVIRRLGLALPASVSGSGGAVAHQAAALLQRSPRFVRGRGFRVNVEGGADSGSACLAGPAGEVLACANVTARAGESADAAAQRLVGEFHAQAFAPRVDLSQADLRSLDGSTTAGRDRSDRQLQGILETLGAGEQPKPRPR